MYKNFQMHRVKIEGEKNDKNVAHTFQVVVIRNSMTLLDDSFTLLSKNTLTAMLSAEFNFIS